MAEQEQQQDEGRRPSFSTFWKQSTEAQAGKQITFVDSGGGSQLLGASSSSTLAGQEPETAGLSEKEKAQVRRQQVRKAQIQHRQRKANYTKQLELDVCRFRGLIATTEREVSIFKRENDVMKRKLEKIGLRSPDWKRVQVQQQVTEVQIMPERMQVEQQQLEDIRHSPMQAYDHVNAPLSTDTVELFGDIDVRDITVTMSIDEVLGSPSLQISSSSSSIHSTESLAAADSIDQIGGQLSPAQETLAVNLILALEHICWDHFHPRQFPAKGDPTKAYSGHTLMASSFAMSDAPNSVYRATRGHNRDKSKSLGPISWQSHGITLEGLYGLASTLNPGDKELTPVQAWFELAERYPPGLLLSERVIDALKAEFTGVVQCLHFGAIIEREAFESVVGRVMAAEISDTDF